ncbi:MAG TPA: L-seryl-tRNA(Sec) selenium transferase [bacterium]
MSAHTPSESQTRLRQLPSVTEADRHLAARGLPSGKAVRGQVTGVLERYRAALRSQTGGPVPPREEVLQAIEAAVSRPPPNQLRRVINATGVVVHTNLGRAVLPLVLTEAVAPLLHGYINLEYDLQAGKRGERGGRIPELLAQLAGAEAGLVVNNNAAAVLLMLSALAAGREVIVSRGELVEIGGSFRVPDIMRQSGVRLVEVGTTNRTRLADYADAITPQTAALLKVHRSNFVMSGFVEEAGVAELAGLGAARGVPVWHDLGSGNFYRFEQPALRGIPTVEQELRAGADVLTLSGDKLLGSVQAGIVVGRAEPLGRMRRHPLYRSLRVDRVRAALLEQSLLAYLEIDRLRSHNTVIDLLERTVADMEPLAAELLVALKPAEGRGLAWELVRDQSLAGGGAVPEVRIETLCLALHRPGTDGEALAAALRTHEPPVVARLAEGRVLLDFRTLFPQDLPEVAAAVTALCGA